MGKSYTNVDGDNVRVESDRIYIAEPLRNRVWAKCNSKCTKCGCTAQEAKDKGEELQINHIIPFKDGGRTEFNNLDLNCTACNIQGREDNKPRKQGNNNTALFSIPVVEILKKHPGGRPPLYKTPEDMKDSIVEYFLYCVDNNAHPTVTGLALFLGYSQRQDLAQAAHDRPEFNATLAQARAIIEENRLQGLVDRDSKNTRGPIFDLVNNHGYRSDSDVRVESVTWSIERKAPPAVVGNEAKSLPAPQAVVVEGSVVQSSEVKESADVMQKEG